MRQVLARATSVVRLVGFVLVGLATLPMVLFVLGVDAALYGVRSEWPNSARARAVHFWGRLLAPVAFIAGLAVWLAVTVARRPPG